MYYQPRITPYIFVCVKCGQKQERMIKGENKIHLSCCGRADNLELEDMGRENSKADKPFETKMKDFLALFYP